MPNHRNVNGEGEDNRDECNESEPRVEKDGSTTKPGMAKAHTTVAREIGTSAAGEGVPGTCAPQLHARTRNRNIFKCSMIHAEILNIEKNKVTK